VCVSYLLHVVHVVILLAEIVDTEFFCCIHVYSSFYDVWYVHLVFDSSMCIVCLRSMLGAV